MCQDLVQAQTVFHRQGELGQDFPPGVRAHHHSAKNLVFARRSQHLDKAMVLAFGNGPVQVIQP